MTTSKYRQKPAVARMSKRYTPSGERISMEGDRCQCGDGEILSKAKSFEFVCVTCGKVTPKKCPCVFDETQCSGCHVIGVCSKWRGMVSAKAIGVNAQGMVI